MLQPSPPPRLSHLRRVVWSRSAATVWALCSLAGCSADSFSRGVEDDAWQRVDGAAQELRAARMAEAVRPAPAAPEPAQSRPTSQPDSAPASRSAAESRPVSGPALGLAGALRTAVQRNRDYQSRKEGLLRQGFALELTRFEFGPQFQSVVSYLWGGAEGAARNHTVTGTLGATQILPTGGTLGLNSALSTVRSTGTGVTPATDKSWSTSVGATLTQPLLRGFGHEVSHEALTQAERSLLYAVRDFELYRENFVIGIARSYYDLVSQEQQLGNEEENHKQAVFDRRKSEALRGFGRDDDQTVFRARRRELESLDRLIAARAAYERALDEFKILLGQDLGAALAISPAEPPFQPVRLDVASAVLAARQNRLDLRTERQRVEDSERSVRIAAQRLLPDLNATASYALGGADDVLRGAAPDVWSATAGVSLGLPLQRLPEKQAYRNALIDLEQARRGLTLKLDQLELDVRDALRRLASVEQRIALQSEQIVQEQRAVTGTRLRYEAGELDNRDLLEARQSLISAQNELIRLKVDHFIGRLSLLRDLGLLFLDEDGMWQ